MLWRAADRALLAQATWYELKKVTAWRMGFFVREIARSAMRPLLTIFLFQTIFVTQGAQVMAGRDLEQTTRYLIAVAWIEALIFHERLLDLSDQIFQGYVTKYLVMPMRYFTLALARFLQFSAVQLLVASLLGLLGWCLLPKLWPLPVSPTAALVALGLALLGSYCFLLLYFVIHTLAFWLEVVWTLLVLTRLVTLFLAGVMLPLAWMPAPLARILEYGFPYWTIAGPAEILLGERELGDAYQGLIVLGVSCVVLECLRRWCWARGLRRYGGSGM
jgi:ABC-2 type transport system permease protein